MHLYIEGGSTRNYAFSYVMVHFKRAVFFSVCRNDVARVLLEFGARPDQLSANAEASSPHKCHMT